MHRKVSRKALAASTEESDDDEKFELTTCSSSVLAAQIKKIIPSKNFANRKSSVAFACSLEKIQETLLQKKSMTALRESIFDRSRMSVHVVESQVEDLLVPETKEEAVDPELIKTMPVPLSEKKFYREVFSLPPEKVQWSDKIKDGAKYNYKNMSNKFELWRDTLKEIEGYFGSGTVSYFLFLRWLLLMNCSVFLINLIFLILPQLVFTPVEHFYKMNDSSHFTSSPKLSQIEIMKKSNIFSEVIDVVKPGESHGSSFGSSAITSFLSTRIADSIIINGTNMSDEDVTHYCHTKYTKEINLARESGFIAALQNFLQGTGWMEPTLFFLGAYPEKAESSRFTYNVPLAFILVFIKIYCLCFIMMMYYSSSGIRETVMTRIGIGRHFANDLFSAWDYCICDARSAEIHHKSFTNDIKSTLSEIRYIRESKARSTSVWVKLYLIRGIVNGLVIAWILGCYFLIYQLVAYQLKEEEYPYESGFRTLVIQYLPPVSVTVVRSISPILFNALVSFEDYHIRTRIGVSLARNVFLGLTSVFVLVASFHQQITCTPTDVCGKGQSHCRSPSCWETYVGQELYKLIISEFFATTAVFLLHDVPRDYFVSNYDNEWTRFIGHAQFYLPTEVLKLIYLQTICWLGVFYSPILPLMFVIQLIYLFFIKRTSPISGL